MCGIALHFERKRKSENGYKKVKEMLENIKYRGKDSSSLETFKLDNLSKIFLGHNRLSIFDTTDAGKQPFFSQNKRFCIIYNGEIYNFKDLKKDLIDSHQIKFNTNCDTEVLIELWNIYGSECLKKIHGMYSFCIFDKYKEILYVSRDPYGIKPLWFHVNENEYQFCSELKPLLSLNKKDKNELITEDGINSYLLFGYVPHTIQFFKNYFQIEPGYVYEFKKNSFKKNLIFFNESITPSESKIRNEIHSATKSDVPVGCFLSGGVDSASIATMADKNKEIICYTIDYKFNNQSFSKEDVDSAKSIAKSLNCKHKIIELDEKNLFFYFKSALKCLSLPVDDTSIGSLVAVSKESKKDRVKVLLSGTGGDEIYGGYSRYFQRRLFRAISSNLGFPKKSLNYKENLFFIFNFLEKICSTNILLLLYRFLDPGFDSLVAATGSKDFFKYLKRKKRLNFQKIIYKAFKECNSNISKKDSNDKEIIYDTLFYLNDLLFRPFDEVLMRYTIEGRPGLIPPNLYHSRFQKSFKNSSYSQSKIYLKSILKDNNLLELIVKNKNGFGGPVKSLYLNNKKEIDKSIKNLIDLGLVDKNLISNVLKTKNPNSIFRLFALSCWLES